MSAVQKACHRPVFGHFFILVTKAYNHQQVSLCGNGIKYSGVLVVTKSDGQCKIVRQMGLVNLGW